MREYTTGFLSSSITSHGSDATAPQFMNQFIDNNPNYECTTKTKQEFLKRYPATKNYVMREISRKKGTQYLHHQDTEVHGRQTHNLVLHLKYNHVVTCIFYLKKHSIEGHYYSRICWGFARPI